MAFFTNILIGRSGLYFLIFGRILPQIKHKITALTLIRIKILTDFLSIILSRNRRLWGLCDFIYFCILHFFSLLIVVDDIHLLNRRLFLLKNFAVDHWRYISLVIGLKTCQPLEWGNSEIRLFIIAVENWIFNHRFELNCNIYCLLFPMLLYIWTLKIEPEMEKKIRMFLSIYPIKILLIEFKYFVASSICICFRLETSSLLIKNFFYHWS